MSKMMKITQMLLKILMMRSRRRSSSLLQRQIAPIVLTPVLMRKAANQKSRERASRYYYYSSVDLFNQNTPKNKIISQEETITLQLKRVDLLLSYMDLVSYQMSCLNKVEFLHHWRKET